MLQNVPLSIMVGSRWSFIVTGDPTCTLLDRWLMNTDRHTGEKVHGKKLLLTKSIILTQGRREEHNAVLFFLFFLSFF